MCCGELVQGPFGIDAAKGATVPARRTVLVVVHSVVTGTRLADVLPVVAEDWRVQVVFTPGPSLFTNDVRDFLHRLGAFVIPWRQAIRERFDVALAADTGQLERLHAPVVLIPHGAGYGKLPARWQGHGFSSPLRHARGTEAQQLVYHGRVVPSAILLAHHNHLVQLRGSCPEAAPAAVIAGDPCHDRLLASLPRRDAYRRALGVGDGQRLILVGSSWGPGALLGQDPRVLARLVAELPAGHYRIATALHPDIYDWHGSYQVTSWTNACLRKGMTLLPSPDGWRAALVAADLVLTDHGSLSVYGADIGLPVVLGTFPAEDVAPGSPIALLGQTAPRLDPGLPLRPQLEQAMSGFRPGLHEMVRSQVTSAPGQARQITRKVIYRLLDLDEPPGLPRTDPVPVPRLPWGPDTVPDGGREAC